MSRICNSFMVWCVADRVRWATLYQKVQGHFLSPVRSWATPFSNVPLWLTLFVEGVNDRLLDHCQVSSFPYYRGFRGQQHVVDVLAVASLGTYSAAAAAKQIYNAKTKYINIVMYNTMQISPRVVMTELIIPPVESEHCPFSNLRILM